MGDITSGCCNPTTQLQQISSDSFSEQPILKANYRLDFQEMSPQIRSLIDEHLSKEQLKNNQEVNSEITEEVALLYTVVRQKKSLKNHQNQPQYPIFYKGAAFKPNQLLNGYGTIYFPEHQYFEGMVIKNRPSKGIFVFHQHCFYVGEFLNLNAEGQGRYENKQNGYTYVGNWSKNLPHGVGQQKYENGDVFEGQFMYGSKFGHGKYTYQDGRIYEGSFYNNLTDGHGKMIFLNKDSYEGEWKLGQLHGHGVFKWHNGEIYQGEYQNGLREGNGKYTFINGSFYEGGWKNGFEEGQGIIKEGYDQIKGIWEAGIRIQ